MSARDTVMAGATTTSSASGPLTWTYQDALAQASIPSWGTANVVNIKYLNQEFVALGTSGKLAGSSDGTSWTIKTGLENTNNWTYNDIEKTPSTYVAVGTGSGGAYSTDGLAWTRFSLPITTTNEIAYSGSVLVAAGSSGGIATSTDGITWNSQSSLSSGAFGTTQINTIEYGNNLFVVGGLNASTAYSTDGVTWSNNTSISKKGVNFPQNVAVLSTAHNGGVRDKYVAGGTNGYLAYSTDSVNWTLVPGLQNLWGTTTSANVNGLAYSTGDSKFVAVGPGGKFAYSTDGLTWTSATTPANFGTGAVRGVTSNNDIFVAWGENGRIATSEDGVTWIYRDSATTAMGSSSIINSVAIIGNGTIYLATTGGAIGRSTDSGVTWTNVLSSGGPTVINKGAGSGLVGGINNNPVKSSDGISWAGHGFDLPVDWNGASSSIVAAFTMGTSGFNNYFIVGSSGKVASAPLSGTITWTVVPILEGTSWGSASFGANPITSAYLAPGSTTMFFTGPNARLATWFLSVDTASRATYLDVSSSASDWDQNSSINSINWNGNQFLAVGGLGCASTSPDGVTWTYNAGLRSLGWASANKVTWTGSNYVVTGSSTSNSATAATSPDGLTWTNSSSALTSTYFSTLSGQSASLAANSNTVLIGGNNGALASSTNTGTTWAYNDGLAKSQTVWGSNTNINCITFGNSVFVTCNAGKSAISADGVTWTYSNQLSTTGWGLTQARGITYGNSQFLVVGDNGAGAISSDGLTWTYLNTLVNSTGVRTLKTVAWNGSIFLIGREDGRTATSSNGTTWQGQASPGSGSWGTIPINAIIWAGTKFLAVGNSGRTATSPEGLFWTFNSTDLSHNFRSVAWNGSVFVAGTSTGLLLYSYNGSTWTTNNSLINAGFGSNSVDSIIWTGTQFVAIGNSAGKNGYSTDGITWNVQSSLASTAWAQAPAYAGAFGNGITLVGGQSAKLATGIVI